MKMHSVKLKVLALILAFAMIVPMFAQSMAFAENGHHGDGHDRGEAAETVEPDLSAYIGAKVIEVIATDKDDNGKEMFRLYDKPNGKYRLSEVLTSGYDENDNRYENENSADVFDMIVKDVEKDEDGVLWFYFEVSKLVKANLKDELYNYEVKAWLNEDTVKLDTVISAAGGTTIFAVGDGLPADASLSTETVNVDAADYRIDEEDVVAAMDIKLVDGDGNELQPGDGKTVTLTFDATKWGLEDGEVVNIIHDHDGEVSVMDNYLILNGELKVTVSNFSIFVVQDLDDTIGQRVDPGDEVTLFAGDEPTIFYWTDDADGDGYQDYRDGRDASVWHVNDPDGTINYEVHEIEKGAQGQVPWYLHYAPYVVVTPVKATEENNVVTLTMDYVTNNNGQATQQFKIRVEAPNDFYVKDEVAQNGCLVPAWPANNQPAGEVTYKWTRSDGAVIKSDALTETGGVNIALDCGGATNNGTLTYTVTAHNADGSVVNTAQYEVLYGREILNPSFETPNVRDSGQEDCNATFFNGYPGLYWKTTAPSTATDTLTKDIEIITVRGDGNGNMNHGFIRPTADGNGYQYAEVNAEAYGTLYQDMLTTPGAEFTWNFSHAARTTDNSQNTIYIILAATEDAQKVTNREQIDAILDKIRGQQIPENGEGYLYTDNDKNEYRIWRHTATVNSGWTNLSGTYTIPEGQYLTRLFFASETTGDYDPTLGNLIDGVRAGQQMSYKIEYYIDNELQSERTQQDSASVYDYVELTNLPADYAVTSVTVNGYPYQDDISKGLYITEYTGEGDNDAQIVMKVYLKQRAITVTKNLVINGWTNLTEAQRNALIEQINNGYNVTFYLKKEGDTVATASGTISTLSSNGTASQLLEFKNNGASYTPNNGTYTVEEVTPLALNGYKLVSTTYSASTVTLDSNNPNANVTVTNTYELSTGSLTIAKKVVGLDTVDLNKLSFNFEVWDVATNKLLPNVIAQVQPNGSLTFENLTAGQTIRIVEKDVVDNSSVLGNLSLSKVEAKVEKDNAQAQFTDITSTKSITAEIVAGKDVKVTFQNTYATTKLTITKTIPTTSTKDESFVFIVNGEGVNNMKVVVQVPEGSTEKTVTITGLKIGAIYTVTEMSFNNDYAKNDKVESAPLNANGGSVSFTNTKSNKWLTESAHTPNVFKTETSTDAGTN